MADRRVCGTDCVGSLVFDRVLEPFVSCGNPHAMHSTPVVLMIMRWISGALLAFFVLSVSAPCKAQIYHDPRRKTTVGFSVELNFPPETVSKIVNGVAGDGYIRGTSMYAKEITIDDADIAKTSNAFTDPAGNGQVIYKSKAKVISPAHFPGDGDIGTVTVRYV